MHFFPKFELIGLPSKKDIVELNKILKANLSKIDRYGNLFSTLAQSDKILKAENKIYLRLTDMVIFSLHQHNQTKS